MAGYLEDNSRSVNAALAEEDGKLPLTRAIPVLAKRANVTRAAARKALIAEGPCEWHHTGRFGGGKCRRTDYYDVEAALDRLFPEQAARREFISQWKNWPQALRLHSQSAAAFVSVAIGAHEVDLIREQRKYDAIRAWNSILSETREEMHQIERAERRVRLNEWFRGFVGQMTLAAAVERWRQGRRGGPKKGSRRAGYVFSLAGIPIEKRRSIEALACVGEKYAGH